MVGCVRYCILIFIISAAYMYVLGHAKDKILNELSLKYADDPVLLSGILSALPKRMESTLNMYKNRLLGTLPKTRDEFDLHPLLARVDGGEKIIVLDSYVDLPFNYKLLLFIWGYLVEI